MRVLVCGSRTWEDIDPITEELALLLNDAPADEITIVHGGCPTGADAMAHDVAQWMNYNIEVHPADWEKHGKRAGPRRNREMIKSGVDRVIAFKNARHNHGTDGTIRLAIDAHLRTAVIYSKDYR